ncbi:MAG: hypothetical protein JJ992_06670, partial [Planctomycetes bacterium]|nr:hypothetical protein [Planctomycetota bacterium]
MGIGWRRIVVQRLSHLDGPNASYDASNSITRLTYNLPQAMHAGSTVTQSYTESVDYDNDGLP